MAVSSTEKWKDLFFFFFFSFLTKFCLSSSQVLHMAELLIPCPGKWGRICKDVGHCLCSSPRHWNLSARVLHVSYWSGNAALPPNCLQYSTGQSYPVPRSAAQGHSKPYLGSQPVKQASVFRKVTSVSVICAILGLTRSLWVSLFPIPMKYVGSRQKLCFWFCTPRPCNVQVSSTWPYLCNCSEGKSCYLGHNMEHRQMKSLCILIKLSWRGKKR